MPNPRYRNFLSAAARFRAHVRTLASRGIKQTEIARRSQVSRQRINQILHDKASMARSAIALAVRLRKIKPASAFRCVDCNEPATEYDHRDYANPNAVDPVCKRCNGRRGRGQNGKGQGHPTDLQKALIKGARFRRRTNYRLLQERNARARQLRDAHIYKLRLKGRSMASIGREYRLSRERVRQIILKEDARRK